jgi:hypothetical protein
MSKSLIGFAIAVGYKANAAKLYLKSRTSGLETVSTGSGSDLVNEGSQNHWEYCMLTTDQVPSFVMFIAGQSRSPAFLAEEQEVRNRWCFLLKEAF